MYKPLLNSTSTVNKIELAVSTHFTGVEFKDITCILIFIFTFLILSFVWIDELNGTDSNDGCCIMSEEHFGHLLLAIRGSFAVSLLCIIYYCRHIARTIFL